MSSEHLERSLSLRRAGYSCGQSVLIPYAAEFGLDEELASAMALPLAGGMAKGRVCGCLSGAALVIGLKLGRGFPQNLRREKGVLPRPAGVDRAPGSAVRLHELS